MKPLNNFIYIKPVEAEYFGGLADPRAKSERAAEKALVVAIGPEVQSVKKGDTVVYKSYNLFVIELDKKEYNFITEQEVIAKL